MVWSLPIAGTRTGMSTTVTTPAFATGKLVYSVPYPCHNCAMGTKFSTITTIIICSLWPQKEETIHVLRTGSARRPKMTCRHNLLGESRAHAWSRTWVEDSGRTRGHGSSSRSQQLLAPLGKTPPVSSQKQSFSAISEFPQTHFISVWKRKKHDLAHHPWKGYWPRCRCFGFIFSVSDTDISQVSLYTLNNCRP